jgi:hypothetical protein
MASHGEGLIMPQNNYLTPAESNQKMQSMMKRSITSPSGAKEAKMLINKISPAPWEAKNIPAAGWEIFAKLRSWDSRLLRFWNNRRKPTLSVELTGDADIKLTAMLGYEEWCQFPAEGWDDELAANAIVMSKSPQMLYLLESSPEYLYGNNEEYFNELEEWKIKVNSLFDEIEEEIRRANATK